MTLKWFSIQLHVLMTAIRAMGVTDATQGLYSLSFDGGDFEITANSTVVVWSGSHGICHTVHSDVMAKHILKFLSEVISDGNKQNLPCEGSIDMLSGLVIPPTEQSDGN